jgi:hypothetical protein
MLYLSHMYYEVFSEPPCNEQALFMYDDEVLKPHARSTYDSIKTSVMYNDEVLKPPPPATCATLLPIHSHICTHALKAPVGGGGGGRERERAR